jgi:hypothetical protein
MEFVGFLSVMNVVQFGMYSDKEDFHPVKLRCMYVCMCVCVLFTLYPSWTPLICLFFIQNNKISGFIGASAD